VERRWFQAKITMKRRDRVWVVNHKTREMHERVEGETTARGSPPINGKNRAAGALPLEENRASFQFIRQAGRRAHLNRPFSIETVFC
jgi:hypothetical protein